MFFVLLSCSFVSQVPSLPAFRGNGRFHDAKIIRPDLLSVTPITVHATIFTGCPPRPHLRDATPGVPGVAGKLRSSGHPGCSEGSVRPGCPERGLYPVASVRLRPALVSWLSPCPGFFRIPVFPASRFPRFTVSLSGGRRRIPGCRIGGCIVLFRFISMRNPKKRRKLRNPCFDPA